VILVGPRPARAKEDELLLRLCNNVILCTLSSIQTVRS